VTSGRALSVAEQEKLFQLWLKTKSPQKVADLSGITVKTVCRYRKKNNWVKREAQIKEKAQKQTDDKAVYSLKNELSAVNVFINAHIQRLAKMLQENKLRATPKEFRELVRLKADLLKDVEPEIPVDPEKDNVADLIEKFSERALVKVAEAAAADMNRIDGKKKP